MTETQNAKNNDPIELVPLAGSERPPAEGAQPAEVPISHRSEVAATVVLRRRSALPSAEVVGGRLTSSQLAERFGADPEDAKLVASTLESLGFTVESTDLASRRIRIRGTVAAVARAFGAELENVSSGAVESRVVHRHRTGGLSIPKPLDGIVTAVLGLDDRPQARAQFRIARAHAASVSYTPVQLGEIYDFPADTDGSGQTIAIVELGGGYEQSDLDTYFSGLGIASPSVSAVGVDGAKNEPGKDPSGADGEVLLDIEVVGALAPRSTVLVYFAPNTDAGFVDAVADAAHATPTPAAISISWGQSEDQWTTQARTAFDDALQDAAALGITVTAAAGDNGSSDGSSDGVNHADFPASSPHALACGGTSLRATTTSITSETVWNNGAGGGATGGGVSDVFALPDWQVGAGVPVAAASKGGRGVPDVSANADPDTGYEVLVDGTRAVYGGTSAVAPLWAALVARISQAIGQPLGLAQPRFYQVTAGFRDVTSGDNGSYSANVGWDACTGLGSPDGAKLLASLQTTSPK
ncbi:MAG TPA: S53 family peptidase [Galbitalea sp.]|jgi:kumamolisin